MLKGKALFPVVIEYQDEDGKTHFQGYAAGAEVAVELKSDDNLDDTAFNELIDAISGLQSDKKEFTFTASTDAPVEQNEDDLPVRLDIVL